MPDEPTIPTQPSGEMGKQEIVALVEDLKSQVAELARERTLLEARGQRQAETLAKLFAQSVEAVQAAGSDGVAASNVSAVDYSQAVEVQRPKVWPALVKTSDLLAKDKAGTTVVDVLVNALNQLTVRTSKVRTAGGGMVLAKDTDGSESEPNGYATVKDINGNPVTMAGDGSLQRDATTGALQYWDGTQWVDLLPSGNDEYDMLRWVEGTGGAAGHWVAEKTVTLYAFAEKPTYSVVTKQLTFSLRQCRVIAVSDAATHVVFTTGACTN